MNKRKCLIVYLFILVKVVNQYQIFFKQKIKICFKFISCMVFFKKFYRSISIKLYLVAIFEKNSISFTSDFKLLSKKKRPLKFLLT